MNLFGSVNPNPPPPKMSTPSSQLSRLHRVRSHHNAITVAFCDISSLAATITTCLSAIKHLQISYSAENNKWQFVYGSRPKFSHSIMPNRREISFKQATLFYAALEAFDKFPQNFDAEDIDRRDQYRFVVDRHGDEDSTPPYCVGIVSLYYIAYNNTTIVEIHKLDAIDKTKAHLTTSLIYNKIFDALKNGGFDVSPFDNAEFQKNRQ